MFECSGLHAAGHARLVSPQVMMLLIDRFADSYAAWAGQVFYSGRMGNSVIMTGASNSEDPLPGAGAGPCQREPDLVA
jgi:hypothetical protein